MSGSPIRARLSRVDLPAGTAARLFPTSPPCRLRCSATRRLDGRASARSRGRRGLSRWSARLLDLSRRPGLEGGHELALVDQPVLQREQSEEEMAGGGHGTSLPGSEPGRRAFVPRCRGPLAWPRAG